MDFNSSQDENDFFQTSGVLRLESGLRPQHNNWLLYLLVPSYLIFHLPWTIDLALRNLARKTNDKQHKHTEGLGPQLKPPECHIAESQHSAQWKRTGRRDRIPSFLSPCATTPSPSLIFVYDGGGTTGLPVFRKKRSPARNKGERASAYAVLCFGVCLNTFVWNTTQFVAISNSHC